MKKLVMDLPEINDYRMVEGLNQLKTNLAFCGKDIKVITMTSSVLNEGKSSVSLSLSRTLAESGKKILNHNGCCHQYKSKNCSDQYILLKTWAVWFVCLICLFDDRW